MSSPKRIIIRRDTISLARHHDPPTFSLYTVAHSNFNSCFSSSITGYLVQECCFAKFTQFYFIEASLSHYAISSIDGSSQIRARGPSNLFIVETTVQEYGFARFASYYVTAASPSHYAVSNIDGSSHIQLYSRKEIEKGQLAPQLPCALIPITRRNTPKSSARRLNHSVTLCLVFDVFQSVLMKAKLAFEIHLVSLRSFVEFKINRANFSIKSSQIGILLLGIVQGYGASHQKLLPGNNPTASYWCINVDFDYQLFLRTIALGIKVSSRSVVIKFEEGVQSLRARDSTWESSESVVGELMIADSEFQRVGELGIYREFGICRE
ncbi:unnamed protein product [Eruca vesicaria subsp. sativa]|uniref:Uncharacterized protein n=1 Tax=Eruca vesicaria subsp. sativa TaxID=29727 RepID=A0ABC8L748_ERUVS|nr:unnamed protein product [Eruca vesicaria subsp. sativa]